MSTPIPSSQDGTPQTGEIDGIWDALERLAERIDARAPDDGAEEPGPSST